MSLALIVGPPNSGRAGAVLDRFQRALAAGGEPVLVVPTRDDVDRFERELCARPGGLLGGTVTSFPGLFGEVARAASVDQGRLLSPIQRIWLARAAARQAELGVLRRSARRAGFAPALEALLTDLQAAGLDAASFAALVAEAEAGAYETELARLFTAYERLRDELGYGDRHRAAAAATAALRARPARWGERPVLLYGFDDLSREQIELLAALSGATEVTVALAYEDRAALAARAELREVLREELGGELVAELAPDDSHTASPTLFHLERNLFEREAQPAPCDGSLSILEASGERGEAELLARRIAALLAAGADPDEIAVAVRTPDRTARPLARVLASFGIPVAAEAAVPLTETATGSAVVRLLGIARGEGTAEDLVAFLRGPARARPAGVDWLERQVRRERLAGAEQALEAWRQRGGREPWALEELRRAGDDARRLADVLGRLAADIAERPHLRSAPRPSGEAAVELRAAAELSRTLAEVAELGPHAPGLAELAELVEHVRVPLWRGPTEGRVRILSPYRLRAGRVAELFIAGLNDGSFPAPQAGEPLLPESRRRELGISSHRDPAAEERYLFYTCVSRPQRALHLCYRIADESGQALARSPFVEEVRALLDPPPPAEAAEDELEARLRERIGVGELAVEPERAASVRDLARALAALPADAAAARLARLELPDRIREGAAEAVARARAGIEAAAAPGPLRDPAVLAELAGRGLYGASTLEEYDLCPYRWFVAHELDPQPIEPDPEPREAGGVVHAALERLYREPPDGTGSRPSGETLAAWIEAAGRRLREVASEAGWDLDSARARISLARLDAVLARFLRRDAETGGPLQPDRALLEAAFGAGEDDPHPAAEIGDFALHGRIDRIDVSSDGKALIRDYKLSSKVVAGRRLLDEGKLQLPLYMRAVRGIGLEPVGGLYHPLGASRDDTPRGLLAAAEKGALIPEGTGIHVRTDFVDDEELEEIVEGAVARAGEIVAAMRSGRVLREPRGGACPSWCDFAAICRMERGVRPPDEEEEEEAAGL